MRTLSIITRVLAGLLLAAATPVTHAGDWPQILGPSRDGHAVAERLADAWPSGGPQVVWQRDTGSGLAGLVVADGVAVLFHRLDDREVVEAMDARTGRVLWQSSAAAEYVPSFTEDDGPRAPPVIDRGRVYVYGAMGLLRCLDLKTGKEIWTRDTFAEFNSKRLFHGEPPEGYFGLASSPIVVGDTILVNVGGDTQGAGIVALAIDDGRTVWKATDERASYSSPVLATVDGLQHAIFVTRLNVVSLNPEDGRVRFRIPFGRTGPTVNAANPVVFDGHLFVTASYGIGSVLAKIGSDDAEILWRDSELLSSQYTTPIHRDGHLFAIDGRQDGPAADLMCFDPKTRKVRWIEPSFGYATLLFADGKLLIAKTDGELVLAKADPERYVRLARARVEQGTMRALPALSDGLLYVRGRRTLKCLDLRPAK